ncbi:MAG: glycosyltransferase [Candidatus Omnitrophota bacterium]|nr:glycosyltransferase [Candidatus Omnitrophota bacterium]
MARPARCDLVLLTWDRADLLKPGVERLLLHTRLDTRLIIVDNGSSEPETLRYLSEVRGTPWVEIEVVRRPQNDGFAAGINTGLAQTRAPWICVLNNDILVTAGWLSELIHVATSHPTLGLLNPMSNEFGAHPQPGETVDDVARRLQPLQGRWLEATGAVGFCLLMPRRVFERVGYLDETFWFMYYEDADYSLRVRRAGYFCAIAEGAYVYHLGSATAKRDPTREQRFLENGERFYRKWRRPRPQRIAYVLLEQQGPVLDRAVSSIRHLVNDGHRVWVFGDPAIEFAIPRHREVTVVRLSGPWRALTVLWRILTKKKRFHRIVAPSGRFARCLQRFMPLHRAAVEHIGDVPQAEGDPGRAMDDRATISAVIITKNEGARILNCLTSLDWVDEIVVVDDESTDRTREHCRQVGATVIVRRSGGDFDEQRNAGIEAARGQWILQLDADEVIPPPLRDEIRSTVQQERTIVAYRVHRLNHFLGRPMRYGGFGWHGVKLFKRSSARYVGHSVHETLEVRGSIADLAQPIHHYPFQSLTQFMERQNFYSDVEARLLRQARRELSAWALRSQLFLRPLKLFWKSYVKKQGWREGMHGLVFAALFAWVHFLKWAKYWASSSAFSVQRSTLTTHPQITGSELPTDGRETLSVVVLTKNEEPRIARCLESVRWADEIIVVDGASTDRTPEICRSFGATVVSHAFDGSFATDRNLGMQHAHGEWVLQIDADDVVTPGFRASMERLLQAQSPHAAFSFYRRSVLLNRPMRYGGWYYTVPNLVRRDRAVYEGVVHERPVIRGTVGELAADVEHHPCEDLSSFVARHNRYTTLQAEELLRRLGPQAERDLRRQIWRRPWKTFWKSYVKKAGYREGLHGLVFAEFYAGIELLKWAKVWERSVPRRA